MDFRLIQLNRMNDQGFVWINPAYIAAIEPYEHHSDVFLSATYEDCAVIMYRIVESPEEILEKIKGAARV